MSTDSNPIDGFREAVGELVSELGTLVPRLVDRSREQATVVAKLIEQLPCLGLLGSRRTDAEDVGAPDLRLVPTASAAKRAPAQRPAAKKPAPGTKPAAAKKQSAAKRSVAKKAPAKKAPAKKAPPAENSPLAIPDYDELAASQVIPRLDSMSADELEAIRLHESGNRQRRTILSRVAQLQTS